MQEDLLSLLNSSMNTTTNSVIEVAINLTVALLFGLVIALVYRRTHHGISYSQGFVISLALVTIIAAAAMMVIGSNLARAFGLVGALSIIRYRTVVKDTRDAAYIFLALVVGFGTGVGAFHIAGLTCALVLATAYALTRHHFGILHYHEFILSFDYAQDGRKEAAYSKVFDRFCKSTRLLHAEPGGKEKTLFLTFDVTLRNADDSAAFVEALEQVKGIGSPKLVFAGGDSTV